MPRFSVAARSPLTGAFGLVRGGGLVGTGAEVRRLRRRRHKGPVPSGRCTSGFDDGEVEIKDASAVWGMDTGDAQERSAASSARSARGWP